MAKRSFNRPPSGYTQYPSVTLPEVWPLVSFIETRSDDFEKDAHIINGYADVDKQNSRVNVRKRPCFDAGGVVSAAVGRGMYTWQGEVYSIFGNNIYRSGALLSALGPGGGRYHFLEMIEGPYLVFGNGTLAYYTDGVAVTLISDPDFPADFCRGWAYLNGRVYVMDLNANIQGSDAGDPTAWDPLNTIQARNEPGIGVALTKQVN
jgi:hypothetical protein